MNQEELLRLGGFANNSDADSSSSGGLGVLTSDLEEPVMSETSVLFDLLHTFDVLSDLGFEGVGGDVKVSSVSEISSAVESPDGDIESRGVGDDLVDLVPVSLGNLTGSQRRLDVGSSKDHMGESRSDTLDRGESVSNASPSFEVGVEDTLDVLEIVLFLDHEAVAHGFITKEVKIYPQDFGKFKFRTTFPSLYHKN